MAKSSLTGSMKFKALVRTLGIPAPHVMGHLEFMWRPAYDSGSPIYRSTEMIELAAEWIGEPGIFAKAVCDPAHNFIDARKDGQFEIHDFYEHAPDYVKKKIEREKQRKKNTVKRRSQKTYSGGQNLPTADNGGKSLPDETRRDETNEDETRPDQTRQAEPNEDEADACPPSSDRRSACSPVTFSANARSKIDSCVARLMEFEDERNRGTATEIMWIARVEAMALLRGGIVRCHEICDEIESRRNPRVARTKGFSDKKIGNESAWANQQTRAWLEKHEAKSA